MLYLLLFILSMTSALSLVVRQANMQNADLTSSSFQAFDQLRQLYEIGGTRPDLVAKLNLAIAQIEDAKILRAQGNEAGAAKLEEQAQSTIAEVEGAVPAATLKAQQELTNRTLLVIAYIPVVVIASALIFYTSLRAWRWYEKAKLFEMRIVEKKTEDQ
jgi:hypothetical protein